MERIINLKDVPLVDRPHARGGRFQAYDLLQGESGSKGNFFLHLAKLFSDFESPRHRHNFDQIRFQIEGKFDYARDGAMTAGTIGYFPEGVYYGPQSMTGETFTLVLQFGGASGSGYVSEEEFQRGITELKKAGTFNDGVYKIAKPEGGTRNKDAYEAVWEHVNQQSLMYPANRYQSPIFMEPAAFNWRPHQEATGVQRKHLGTFSEAMTEISILQIDSGATLQTAPNTIMFVLNGQGHCVDRKWEKFSTLYSGRHIGTLTATEQSELIQITLPRL